MRLKLLKASVEYKKQILDMLEEWYASGEKIIPYAIRRLDYHDFTYYCENLENKNFLSDGFVTDSTFFCLDEERDIVVGAVNIRHYLNEDEAELSNLAVLPQYRHRNIGRKLLEDCFSKVREAGRTKLKIGIVEENVILRKWYEGFGFEHRGTEKYDFFPFTCGYMEKELGGSDDI